MAVVRALFAPSNRASWLGGRSNGIDWQNLPEAAGQTGLVGLGGERKLRLTIPP